MSVQSSISGINNDNSVNVSIGDTQLDPFLQSIKSSQFKMQNAISDLILDNDVIDTGHRIKKDVNKNNSETLDAQRRDFMEDTRLSRLAEEDIKSDIARESKRHSLESEEENPIRSKEEEDKVETSKLEDQIKDDILGDSVLDQGQYHIIFQAVLDNDMEDFGKRSDKQKAEFLIKLYQDPNPQSEAVLDRIMPFVNANLINVSLQLCSLKYLNTNKLISITKRLAVEDSNMADSNLIKILLFTDAGFISKLNIDTLLMLRKKEKMGESYYAKLMQNSNGKLSKADFQKLRALSARISTICYAYLLEKVQNIVVELQNNHTPLTAKSIDIKWLTREEKVDLLSKLQKKLFTQYGGPTTGPRSTETKKAIQSILKQVMQLKEGIGEAPVQKTQKEIEADKIKQSIQAIMRDTLKMVGDVNSSLPSQPQKSVGAPQ